METLAIAVGLVIYLAQICTWAISYRRASVLQKCGILSLIFGLPVIAATFIFLGIGLLTSGI